ncbi:YugN-like protein [Scopulibacillus darangshiensis]|uniref:YugN-like protein n=1 Tax=Scopulibacillus darangshiensis TaxID=442528 RepID=A0A4R2NX46_9BACL|nr:YugN-like family protein [Scopulibacillus darangshiensis]TCP26592.1 YugN-like protein [Scopulibacillus darangshiensis]
MKTIDSRLSGQEFSLIELENKLKPLGYVIGGNWDYDHGYFDYKIKEDEGYIYLRLPFQAINGMLDQDGAVVSLGEPFILRHKYRKGPDDHVDVGSVTASINQFQTPVEKDAGSDKYLGVGRELVNKLESELMSQ